MTTPGHQIIEAVQRRLRAQQGELEPRLALPVLDQVVGTVLSQHTSDVNSGRAFAQLKARFPTWEEAAHAPVQEVEDAIQNSRRYYNAVVRDYNTRIATFPGNIFASMMGFQPKQFFEVSTSAEREAPQVKF